MADRKLNIEIQVDDQGALKALRDVSVAEDKVTASSTPMAQGLEQAGVSTLGMAAAIGGAVSVVTAVVTELVNCAMVAGKLGGELNDLSLKSGIGVESLSNFRYAAKVLGTDLNSLANASYMMSQRLGEDSTNVEKGLKRLGLSLEEVNRASQADRILMVSDAMRKQSEWTVIAAANTEIFGRGGRENLTLMLEPLRELVTESQRLGHEWSEQEVAAAHDFEKATNRLKVEWEDFTIAIGQHVIPVLTDLLATMNKAGTTSGKLEPGLRVTGPAAAYMQDMIDAAAAAAKTGESISKAAHDYGLLSDAERVAAAHADVMAAGIGRLGEATKMAALDAFAHGRSVADTLGILQEHGLATNADKAALEALNTEYKASVTAGEKVTADLRKRGQAFEDSKQNVTDYALFEQWFNQERVKWYQTADKAIDEGEQQLAALVRQRADQILAFWSESARMRQSVTDREVALYMNSSRIQVANARTSYEEIRQSGQYSAEAIYAAWSEWYDKDRELQGNSKAGWIDAFSGIAAAAQQLAQITGGSFGEIAKAIGEGAAVAGLFVRGMEDVRKGQAAVAEGGAMVAQGNREIAHGYLEIALAAAQAAAAIANATSQGSTMNRVVGGAMSGAATGAAFGPYGAIVGAIAGALVGAIRGIRDNRTGDDIARSIGQQWGIAISEGLQKQIVADSKKYANLGGALSEVAGTIANLSGIIGEVGGLTQANFSGFLAQLSGVIDLYQRFQITASQAGAIVAEGFKTMAAAADQFGQSARDQLYQLVKAYHDAGLASQEMATWLVQQITAGRVAADQLATVAQEARDLGASLEDVSAALRTQLAAGVIDVLQGLWLLQQGLITTKDLVAGTLDAIRQGNESLIAVFVLLAEGAMTTEEAMAALDENFGRVVANYRTGGALITFEIQKIIRFNREMKTNSQEVANFVISQLQRMTAGFSLAASGWANSMLTETDTINEARGAFDDLAQQGSDLVDQIVELQSEDYLTGEQRAQLQDLYDQLADVAAQQDVLTNTINRARDRLKYYLQDGQAGFERWGRIAWSSFQLAMAAGRNAVDVINEMGPGIDRMARAMQEYNLKWTPGFDQLLLMRRIVTENQGLFDSISGINEMLIGMHNSGNRDQAMFTDLTGSIVDSYAALTRLGAGGRTGLMLMQAPLQTTWELMHDFGYETDDATAALVGQAEAAGLVGESHRSAAEVAATAMVQVVKMLEWIAQLLSQTVPGAADDTKQAVGGIGGVFNDLGNQAEGAAGRAKQALDGIKASADSAAGAVYKVAYGSSPGGFAGVSAEAEKASTKAKIFNTNMTPNTEYGRYLVTIGNSMKNVATQAGNAAASVRDISEELQKLADARAMEFATPEEQSLMSNEAARLKAIKDFMEATAGATAEAIATGLQLIDETYAHKTATIVAAAREEAAQAAEEARRAALTQTDALRDLQREATLGGLTGTAKDLQQLAYDKEDMIRQWRETMAGSAQDVIDNGLRLIELIFQQRIAALTQTSAIPALVGVTRYHDGGEVGRVLSFRPRGLAADESLGVLQSGERVQSRREVAALRTGTDNLEQTIIVELDGDVLLNTTVRGFNRKMRVLGVRK